MAKKNPHTAVLAGEDYPYAGYDKIDLGKEDAPVKGVIIKLNTKQKPPSKIKTLLKRFKLDIQ